MIYHGPSLLKNRVVRVVDVGSYLSVSGALFVAFFTDR